MSYKALLLRNQKYKVTKISFKVCSHTLHYQTKICVLCFTSYLLKTFDLYVLILCVSEGVLSELLCTHIVDIGTFDLHGLILKIALYSHCGH